MSCTICFDFQGIDDLKERDKNNPRETKRNHENLEFAWSEFVGSAKSCYICDILIRGVRGCFGQHNIEERQILHCSILFYYQDWIGANVDGNKEIHFRLRDGRLFEVQLFVTEGSS